MLKERPAAWRLAPRGAGRACIWYAIATVLMTWPVATVMTTKLPKDLGDPLLNCWILAWNAEHLIRAASGDLGTLGRLWHGNIFHPEPFTLGYSELLMAQTLQMLPLYVLSKNIVLGYNLVFLSTFVLSAVGMFLLVRAITGDWRAAFVSGLIYGFLPYRLNQAAHIQVISTQWMPLALFGFHRAIATRRWWTLAGGAAALLAVNLSCGYFLVFFSLFVPPFVVFEMARHGRLRDLRLWGGFVVAAAIVGALTVPFMQPYLELRKIHDTRRELDELRMFSADTWSWLTADAQTTFVSRWVRLLDKPEGALFSGALTMLLAAIGLTGGVRRTWRSTEPLESARMPGSSGRRWRLRPVDVGKFVFHTMLWLGIVVAAWGLFTLLIMVAGAGGLYRVGGARIRIQSLTRSLEFLGIGLAVMMAVSSRVRAFAWQAARSPLTFSALCAIVAGYLALGPDPQAGRDELNGPRLYFWLYSVVPGFDGLRVPARFGAVAMLFLVVVAAFGARDVIRRWPHRAGMVMLVLSAAWIVEATVVPYPIGFNRSADTPDLRAPPSTLSVGNDVPGIYRVVRRLPGDAILMEFPMGDITWEIRHVYQSIFHWRRMVNGYSGYTPQSYLALVEVLRDPYRDPEVAWQRLAGAGVTHVIVHGDAYYDGGLRLPDTWLIDHGAVLVGSVGPESLYRIK